MNCFKNIVGLTDLPDLLPILCQRIGSHYVMILPQNVDGVSYIMLPRAKGENWCHNAMLHNSEFVWLRTGVTTQ